MLRWALPSIPLLLAIGLLVDSARSQPPGQPPQKDSAEQPAAGTPAPPGGVWSWPPQGSAWPVQPGAQETVAPDPEQAPVAPGSPTMPLGSGFVPQPGAPTSGGSQPSPAPMTPNFQPPQQ